MTRDLFLAMLMSRKTFVCGSVLLNLQRLKDLLVVRDAQKSSLELLPCPFDDEFGTNTLRFKLGRVDYIEQCETEKEDKQK